MGNLVVFVLPRMMQNIILYAMFPQKTLELFVLVRKDLDIKDPLFTE